MTAGLRLSGNGERREVRLQDGVATIDGEAIRYREIRRGADLAGLEIAGRAVAVRVAREGSRAFVWCAGRVFEVRREEPQAARAKRASAGEAHGELVAPMPGRVRKTVVRRGEIVEKGQLIVVLEAMKMEHAIRAPRAGVVTRIAHADGDLVDAGAVLAELADVGTGVPGEAGGGPGGGG